MIALDYPPAIPARFAADCGRCPDWEGTPRSSNLTALADFDRHAADHRAGRIAEPAPEPELDTEGDPS